ncbi:MAG: hypothetical protein IKJ87_02560 [Ruminococcus sp.]|nr:hypothetical protein [Ruminococcus sp.]
MKERMVKLIDVKSIVTLSMTLIFGILAVRGQISSEQFLTVFTTIIAFYFGVQYQKNSIAAENVCGKYEKREV